jgi:heme-degrading monooxygenase HmoA/mannose-6-phosphate isomerase-like protein (cupin superfamily)
MEINRAEARPIRAQVMRPQQLPTHDRGSGARTTPLATAARGATTFLNGITWFDAGAIIAHHSHNVTESVMVVHGDAIVDIDGERTPLRVFDTTLVSANVPHHFENASMDSPMAIFWTYGSIDATRTIDSTGVESRVDAEGSDADGGIHASLRENATIRVKKGKGEEFERAVREAAPWFQAAQGARSLSLERSLEDPLEYRLVVGWDTLEDHTERFRASDAFRQWRELIADAVEGTPQAAHFRTVLTAF